MRQSHSYGPASIPLSPSVMTSWLKSRLWRARSTWLPAQGLRPRNLRRPHRQWRPLRRLTRLRRTNEATQFKSGPSMDKEAALYRAFIDRATTNFRFGSPWAVRPGSRERPELAFEVARRRIGGAHRRKNFFGGHAAIHQPDTLGLAILGFDAFQKALQRRLVGGIARQHLIGQGQAVRRDDQGDDPCTRSPR